MLRSLAARPARLLLPALLLILSSACDTTEEPADSTPEPVDMGERPRNPELDLDGDGWPPVDGDCDDDDPTSSPDGVEICDDGIDQDCDGADLSCAVADQDRDGYSLDDGDCDDEDPTRSPARLETCDDGIDQDCNGADLSCDDLDEDGDGVSIADGDCDDQNSRRRPGFDEVCGDGIDQDCDDIDPECVANDSDGDGVTDDVDVCPEVSDPVQADSDEDGVGDLCDNCLNAPNPDQADRDGDERGDACDNDIDQDGDGVSGAAGDCQPENPEVFPGAPEACNGVDDDCNGFVDDACPGVDLRSALAEIPAGPALMGSTNADPEECLTRPPEQRDENCDEVPQRTIQLSAFRIDVQEVTNTQYRACVNAGRCIPPRNTDNFDDPAFADHPVVWISQVEAETYCGWAGGRLPTEAEWERAARGDQPEADLRYPWGDDLPEGCMTSNIANCRETTAAVGSFPGDRTAQGVIDLGGNVHELTAGWYDALYYRRMPEMDPPALNVPGEPTVVPVRGGSYREGPAFSTLTYRGFRLLMGRRDRRAYVGFRCVRTR